MVKKTAVITLLASSFSSFLLFAGEFTASVSETQLSLDESFFLNLTLKDATPKESPTLSKLEKNFFIHSQQHSSNKTITNGKVSASITWKFSLTPKTAGDIEIPPITVSTIEGVFSTTPITMHVAKASTQGNSTGPYVITQIDKTSPYKNEPLIYKALLSSKAPFYNVQSQKMQIENAIVELIEEPKIEEKVLDGILLHVVEFNYLITPLKAGALTIPSIAIQGAVPQKRQQHSSFFAPNMDPFSLLQGFDNFKSFTLMTEELHLDVQPVAPEVSPWIPAKSLSIEEIFPKGQTMQVGEPLSRSFLIKGEGIKASQLPNLEDLLSQTSNFKVYADKPETQEQLLQEKLYSTSKQQYTLIPQEAGLLTLPEMTVAWWDTSSNKKKISKIPSRTIEILPAQVAETTASQEMAPSPTVDSIQAIAPKKAPLLLYGIIGTLATLLTATLAWTLSLQRKIASLTQKAPLKTKKKASLKPKEPVQVAKAPKKKDKLPDLNPT